MNQESTYDNFFEEWKVCNELFKYHEDLKQKRYSYFLSMQAAFMALVGLLGRSLLSDDNHEWLIISIISIFLL